MSAPTHTPGPWFPVPYGDGHDTVICSDVLGDRRIAFMAISGSRYADERRKNWAEIKANARLIAASPDLLAELEKAEAFMSGFEGDPLQEGIDEKLANIRAAIAKAKGVAA